MSLTPPGHAVASAPPAAVVATVTVRVCPVARSPKGQYSTFPTTMVQRPLPSLVIDQLFRFPNVGSGSFSVTFFSIPGPVLATVTVNLTLSPTLYVAFLGVFATVKLPGGVQR